ncbi:MAG: hypothetical protein N4A33_00290 [Bacteriovoracaceae bacterium]|jgi:hypothetical protein|nr:hypothetical protein [Bacteriovoracaceae bacterium]
MKALFLFILLISSALVAQTTTGGVGNLSIDGDSRGSDRSPRSSSKRPRSKINSNFKKFLKYKDKILVEIEKSLKDCNIGVKFDSLVHFYIFFSVSKMSENLEELEPGKVADSKVICSEPFKKECVKITKKLKKLLKKTLTTEDDFTSWIGKTGSKSNITDVQIKELYQVLVSFRDS